MTDCRNAFKQKLRKETKTVKKPTPAGVQKLSGDCVDVNPFGIGLHRRLRWLFSLRLNKGL
jgi:hypothetical protein